MWGGKCGCAQVVSGGVGRVILCKCTKKGDGVGITGSAAPDGSEVGGLGIQRAS